MQPDSGHDGSDRFAINSEQTTNQEAVHQYQAQYDKHLAQQNNQAQVVQFGRSNSFIEQAVAKQGEEAIIEASLASEREI